jgi:hypothetical protein
MLPSGARSDIRKAPRASRSIGGVGGIGIGMAVQVRGAGPGWHGRATGVQADRRGPAEAAQASSVPRGEEGISPRCPPPALPSPGPFCALAAWMRSPPPPILGGPSTRLPVTRRRAAAAPRCAWGEAHNEPSTTDSMPLAHPTSRQCVRPSAGGMRRQTCSPPIEPPCGWWCERWVCPLTAGCASPQPPLAHYRKCLPVDSTGN